MVKPIFSHPKQISVKRLIKYIVVFIVATGTLIPGIAWSQSMYIGVNAGMVNSQVYSLDTDNSFTSEGWGYNFGFYMRYGKRPFYQLGLDWLRSNNETTSVDNGNTLTGSVPLHRFDINLKLGYEIVHRPIFKWEALIGPFIGKTRMCSSDIFSFNENDFKGPQYGFIVGTGIKFTYLVFDVEYSYHLSQLFADGYSTTNPDTHIETLAFKVGFQF